MSKAKKTKFQTAVEKSGYTYDEIAQSIGVGCHLSTIQKLYKGTRFASFELAKDLSDFFKDPDLWRSIVNPKKIKRFERRQDITTRRTVPARRQDTIARRQETDERRISSKPARLKS